MNLVREWNLVGVCSLKTLACAFVFFLFTNIVNAMSITPVLVELSPVRRVASVKISNSSDKSQTFQTELLSWRQLDGNNLYEKTDKLQVVPPIAEIPPGASQIFRVALRSKLPTGNEETYRLIFEDISENTETQTTQSVVNLRFRYDLPVFVTGSGKVGLKPRLGACATPGPSGCVRLDNEGDRFVLVKRLTVEGGTWRKEVDTGFRVLAGAWKQWTFDRPANYAGSLTVNAETSAGLLTIELPARLR
jgi:fimbrial chaperone protein